MANPFELKRFWSGVIGFGLVSDETSGEIETVKRKKIVKTFNEIFRLLVTYDNLFHPSRLGNQAFHRIS